MGKKWRKEHKDDMDLEINLVKVDNICPLQISFSIPYLFFSFLDENLRPYERLCPSVDPLVGWCVGPVVHW